MSARHRYRLRLRTDWFRVIADIQRADSLTLEAIALRVGMPRTTLIGWRNGSEPDHCDGERLLALWSEVTGRALDERPEVFD